MRVNHELKSQLTSGIFRFWFIFQIHWAISYHAAYYILYGVRQIRQQSFGQIQQKMITFHFSESFSLISRADFRLFLCLITFQKMVITQSWSHSRTWSSPFRSMSKFAQYTHMESRIQNIVGDRLHVVHCSETLWRFLSELWIAIKVLQLAHGDTLWWGIQISMWCVSRWGRCEWEFHI
jgi:hypothetical protein